MTTVTTSLLDQIQRRPLVLAGAQQHTRLIATRRLGIAQAKRAHPNWTADPAHRRAVLQAAQTYYAAHLDLRHYLSGVLHALGIDFSGQDLADLTCAVEGLHT